MSDVVLEYIQELLGSPAIAPQTLGAAPSHAAVAAPSPFFCSELSRLPGFSLSASPGKSVKVLVCNVIGMPLAILSDEVQGMHLGSLPLGTANAIQTIDLGRSVIPPQRRQLRQRLTEPGCWLVVRGGHWALGCDNVVGYQLVSPDEIYWCHASEIFPFLQGVEKNRLFACLKLDALLRTAGGDGAINMA